MELQRILKSAWASERRHVLLIGESGSGKTSLLKSFACGEGDAVRIYSDLAPARGENCITLQILHDYCGLLPNQESGETGRESLLRLFRAENAGGPGFVLLLDGIDELDPDICPGLHRELGELASCSALQIVIAVPDRDYLRANYYFDGLEQFREYGMQPLSEDARDALLREKGVEPASLPAELSSFLRKPLFLATFLELAEKGPELVRGIDSVPELFSAIVERDIQKQAAHDGKGKRAEYAFRILLPALAARLDKSAFSLEELKKALFSAYFDTAYAHGSFDRISLDVLDRARRGFDSDGMGGPAVLMAQDQLYQTYGDGIFAERGYLLKEGPGFYRFRHQKWLLYFQMQHVFNEMQRADGGLRFQVQETEARRKVFLGKDPAEGKEPAPEEPGETPGPQQGQAPVKDPAAEDEDGGTKKQQRRRRILIAAAAAVLALALLFLIRAAIKPKRILPPDAAVGDIICFGTFEQDAKAENGKEEIEWLVLARENDRLLLISRCGLDCRPYNDPSNGGEEPVSWENCTLRGWLNADFLNEAFTEEERLQIPAVAVNADRNPHFDTDPGDSTQDKVFLLSVPEAEKYFASDEERRCCPTDYARAKQCSVNDETGACSWWLRSPGEDPSGAANVTYSGSLGAAEAWKLFAAVRPVIWIDLGADVQQAAAAAEKTEESEETEAVEEAEAAEEVVFTLSPSEEITVTDFDTAAELIRGRLETLADGKDFQCEVVGREIRASLPLEAFHGEPVREVLTRFVRMPMQFYLIDMSTWSIWTPLTNTNLRLFPRDFESVELSRDTLPDLDLSAAELTGEHFDTIKIRMTEQWAGKNLEEVSAWKELCFAHDVFSSTWFYNNGPILSDDGRTIWLIVEDEERSFVDAFFHNLQNEPLACEFTCRIENGEEEEIIWEDPAQALKAGLRQVRASDFDESTVTVYFDTTIDDVLSGAWIDLLSVAKNRMDALDMPYAIGRRVQYSETSDRITHQLVIKTGPEHINRELLPLLFESIKVFGGLNDCSCYSTAMEKRVLADGSIGLYIREESQYEPNLRSFVRECGEAGVRELRFGLGSFPILSAPTESADEDGGILFTQLCDGREIPADCGWLLDFFCAAAENNKYAYFDHADTDAPEDEPISSRFSISFGTEAKKAEETVREIAPDALCFSPVNNPGNLTVMVDLYVDGDFPAEAAELCRQIYRGIDFENSVFQELSLYLIDEDNSRGERARCFFRKDYYKGTVTFDPVFLNGRIEKYRDAIERTFSEDPFFAEMLQTDWA